MPNNFAESENEHVQAVTPQPEVVPFTPPELRQRTWDELFTDVNQLIHSTNSLTAEVERLRGELDNSKAIISRDTGEIADYARTVERLNKNAEQDQSEISRLNKGETWQRRIAELESEKQGLYIKLDLEKQRSDRLGKENWQLGKDSQSFQNELEELKNPATTRKPVKCIQCGAAIFYYPCSNCGRNDPTPTEMEKLAFARPFPCVSDQFLDEPTSTIHMAIPDEPVRDMAISEWSITVGNLNQQLEIAEAKVCLWENHAQTIDKAFDIINRLLKLR